MKFNKALPFFLSVFSCAVLWTGCASAPDGAPTTGIEEPLAAPPPLVFREDWSDDAASGALVSERLANASLEATLLGSGGAALPYVPEPESEGGTAYIRVGACSSGPCAIALRDTQHLLDLTGRAKIRWRTMQDGFHEMRVVLKLASGEWLISGHSQGGTDGWAESDFFFDFISWRTLNPDTLTEGFPFSPDFSMVDEIGAACLTVDGAPCTDAESAPRLDWIEVYGNAVPR